MRDAGGFTLLEMLVVCAIAGMLLLAGVPAFRETVLNDPLKSSSRKMIGYIQEIRGKAAREQVAYILFFDLAEDRLYHRLESEMAQEDLEPPQDKTILAMGSGVSIRDLWTSSDGTRDSGLVELWVSRQGYVDTSVIHLQDEEGEGVSLLLSTFLPEVEVQDGFFEPES